MDNHYQWMVKCHVMKNYSFILCCQYAARKEELIYHERRLQTIPTLLDSISRPVFFHFCCLISAKIYLVAQSVRATANFPEFSVLYGLRQQL